LRLAPGKVVIGNLVGGGAAERDGLLVGDELAAVAGSPVRRGSDVIERVQASAGSPLGFTVVRGREELTITVTPDAVQLAAGADRVGRIGAGLQDRILMETVRYGPLESLGHGVRQTWEM